MTSNDFFVSLNEIRAKRKMQSNSCFSKTQLETLLHNSDTTVICEDDLLVLLTDEPDLKRLYYYSDGDNPLKKLPDIISHYSTPVIVDIVGKGDTPDIQASLLTAAGFKHYCTFIRMSTKQIMPIPCDKATQVESARIGDTDLIIKLLKKEFDPLFAHIPNSDEINGAIDKGEIRVVYLDGIIAGLAYFEVISPKLKCLRYFVVRREYRGMGFGAALLMDEFSSSTKSDMYYLWIGTYNKTAELYKRIGFEQDGLKDYIMLYDKKEK